MVNVFGNIALKASTFAKPTASVIVPGLVDKLGDVKVKKSAGECLIVISEVISLGYVLGLCNFF